MNLLSIQLSLVCTERHFSEIRYISDQIPCREFDKLVQPFKTSNPNKKMFMIRINHMNCPQPCFIVWNVILQFGQVMLLIKYIKISDSM